MYSNKDPDLNETTQHLWLYYTHLQINVVHFISIGVFITVNKLRRRITYEIILHMSIYIPVSGLK